MTRTRAAWFLALLFVASCKSDDERLWDAMRRALEDSSVPESDRALRAAEIGWPPDVCSRTIKMQNVGSRRRLLVECFRAEQPHPTLQNNSWIITVYHEIGARGPEDLARWRMLGLFKWVDEVVMVDRWKTFVEGRLVLLVDRPVMIDMKDERRMKLLEARDVTGLAPYDLAIGETGAVLLPASQPRPL